MYSDGSALDLTTLATWASLDSGAAAIDSGGFANAVSPGWTTVSASFSGVSGATVMPITQNGTTLLSISVNPFNAALDAGTQQQFTATANFSDGSSRDVS